MAYSRPVEPHLPPRLLCDGTLGALCRWLRVAGHDTAYLPPAPRRRRDALAQAEVVREAAQREGRTVLTRSPRLAALVVGPVLVVRDDVVHHQLLEVAAALGLSLTAGAFTRCREDNAPLHAVERASVLADVPPYVAATQPRFVRCPACGRVYWGATHRDSMVARLEALERARLAGSAA